MRLQVFLSHSRICSRRKALELVKAGRVTVGAEVIVEPSYDVRADARDIRLDGKKIESQGKSYLLLNKPRGVVSTLQDRHAQRTVLDLLPENYKHLYPVGRLDKDSQGLLLFTNDGDLAFRLLHPSFKVDKVYFVELNRPLDKPDIRRLEKGVLIEGRLSRPVKIRVINNFSFEITLHEGRKRQIRLMCLALGYTVKRLVRIQYGDIKLENLGPGKCRILNENEISALRKRCGWGGEK